MFFTKCRCFKAGALFSVLSLVLIPCGCRFAMPEAKIESKIHPAKDFSASYIQVRLRMRSLVGPMCGEIEQTADQIMAGTTNAAVQRAALLWKMEGVPAMRAALFQPDPFTALGDSWVLCFQMKDYFQIGPGKKSMGEASKIAAASCQRLEEEINRAAVAMTISGDVSKPRAFGQKWAREHPIRYSIAERESTLSRALEKDWATSFGTGEIVAQMTTSMDDLNRRLEIYSDQLLQQGRWQAELFKSDLMSDLPMKEVLSLAERAVQSAEQAGTNVSRLVPSIERAVSVAENAPKLLTVEREATVKAMNEELTRSIEFMREERVAALEGIARERIVVLKELHEMMVTERRSLTEDIEHISLKVVDHAFWRAAQLIAFIFVVLAIRFAALGVIMRKRRAPGG